MFAHRATQREIFDEQDVAPDLLSRGYQFMDVVNRFFGGTRAVQRYVAEHAMRASGRPLHVLDLGSGACGIPLAVAPWARRRGLDVRFTCLEINPVAVRLARRAIRRAREAAVEVVQADAFRFEPSQEFDVAVGSMFFHHLSDQNILVLMARLRQFVQHSVLINDLRRTAGNYVSCAVVSPALPPEIRHDALLSIRRGFRPGELRALLGDLDQAVVTVRRAWFFRVQAEVSFMR